MNAEVFADVYRLLEAAHSWKSVSDNAIAGFYENCSQGLSDDELDDLCGKLLDDESLVRPSRFLRAISETVNLKVRNQSNQAAAQVMGNTKCEEFVRFSRAMKELKAALATGRAYPGRSKKGEHCQEWIDQWNRPLTGDDEVYAEGRRVSRMIAVAGIEIPLEERGGVYEPVN